MVGRSIVVIFALVATNARADGKKLAEAKKAIDAVRYNDAQPLLVAALQEGGATPADVIEIYRLSASTAIVLGHADAAEQYYRRWLALVPNAQLPDTVAPKLREPFVAAQAYMAARGRLSAKAQRRRAVAHDTIEVVIDSDPLAMVATVAVDAARATVKADHVAHVELASNQPVAEVAVLDEFGNHLIELPAGDFAVEDLAPATPPPPPPHHEVVEAPRVPLYRAPLAWAIPALAVAGVGVGFAVGAHAAQNDLATIAAHPGDHFASELDDARARRDRDALIANLAFAVAGACAITSVVMFATAPLTFSPVAGGGATATMSLHW